MFLRICTALLLVLATVVAKAEDITGLNLKLLNERVDEVQGDAARPAILRVTFMKPDGVGPFPLAVMNHGASGGAHPESEPLYNRTYAAFYFLSRGYAVAMPMMRGFSGSQGKQMLFGCNQEEIALLNAKDIEAVIDHYAKDPQIDATRIVVAGQSFGGWNTLGVGALDDPRVKGLVDFVGGVASPTCAATGATLAAAAADFGRRTKAPSLWFYGENDSHFPPTNWQPMVEAYEAAGGRVKLVAFGKFLSDAHQLLSSPESQRIWVPKVDAFLASVDLPSAKLYPAYLPVDYPGPSGYAAVNDINAVPYLNDAGRAAYAQFLTKPMPRVFFLTANGQSGTTTGGFDPLARAMEICKAHGLVCEPYAIDDYVTWRPARHL